MLVIISSHKDDTECTKHFEFPKKYIINVHHPEKLTIPLFMSNLRHTYF